MLLQESTKLEQLQPSKSIAFFKVFKQCIEVDTVVQLEKGNQ